jgi:hypothetical protein
MGGGGFGAGWLWVFDYLSSVGLSEAELSPTDSRAGSGWIYRWCWIVPPWMWAVSGEVAIVSAGTIEVCRRGYGL